MERSNQKTGGKWSQWLAVMVGVTVAASLSSSRSPGITTTTARSSAVDAPKARLEAAVLQSANKAVTAGFEPSLEMKENVDFLLTPALLVQEALSEDVIVTYPSE